MALKLISGDLLFAFGLIVVGAGFVLLYRMSFLPRKSIPYVAAAFAGALGLHFLRKIRRQAVDQAIKDKEKSIEERQKKLDAMAVIRGTADEEALSSQADLDKERAAVLKEKALLEARTAEEKEKIEKMGIQELFEAIGQT